VAPAPAYEAIERVRQILIAWVRIFVQKRLCSHNPTIQTVAALERLFLDESALNGMRFLGRPKAFQSDDVLPGQERDRQLARPHRHVVDKNRAGATLPKTATKPGIVQAEIVSQDVQKRTIRIDIHGVRLAIYVEGCLAHIRLADFYDFESFADRISIPGSSRRTDPASWF